MDPITNHFVHAPAAERYARHRPYFHPRIVERMRAYLAEAPVALAVDVACGTGLSTVALVPVARRVVGLDPSAEMLATAPRDPAITWLRAPAEALPLREACADLVTVSSAYHWLDQPRFLAEAKRVLRPGGLLAVYNGGIGRRMAGNEAFSEWMEQGYRDRYPAPPRHDRVPTAEQVQAAGLTWLGQEGIEQTWPMTLDEYARYLSTRSDVIDVVESGRETADEAIAWLRAQVAPYFGGEGERPFLFDGRVTFTRKA